MFAGHIPEIAILLLVAVIFLGPKKVPEAGRGLGKAIRGFKDETKGLREDFAGIKSDTQGFKQELVGIHSEVHSTVSDAVALNPTVATEPEVMERPVPDPLPTGANEELLSARP